MRTARKPRSARVLPIPLCVGALLVVVLGGGGAPRVASAEDVKKVVADLHSTEAKTLLPILRLAMKADIRRQAWYLATRITAAEPANVEAGDALRKWSPKDLQEGGPPPKAFAEKRDAALKKVGDGYAAVGQTLLGSGGKDTETWPLLERGYAYGSRNGDFVSSIASNGQAWCGTWGTQDKKLFEKLGAIQKQVEFPSEWDDGYLRIRCAWPEAKIARIGSFRLVVGGDVAEAFRWVSALSAIETQFLATFGTRAKEEKDPDPDEQRLATIAIVPDAAAYDKLVDALFVNQRVETKDVEGTSRWYARWTRIGVAIAGVRDNPWIRPEANVFGLAAAMLARRHLGSMAGGRLEGPGGWVLVEGLSGVYEGFAPNGPLGGDIQPERIWKMAVAKAQKASGGLMPWAEFVEWTSLKRKEETRTDVTLLFGGSGPKAVRSAKGVVVSSAQATTLVWMLWQRDAEKKARRLADLVDEAFKRDRMPDLDKILGTKPGALFKAADDAIDAWSPGN